MYVQITTRCNMTCEHCYLACTMDGEDMTPETFNNVLKYEQFGIISIGGGEPTLHPDFWSFLMLSIANCESTWLATNGSRTEMALALAKLARKGVCAVDLSQDCYHDPIDWDVVEAFTKDKNNSPSYDYTGTANDDLRALRDTSMSGNMSPFRNPEDGGDSDNCIGEGLFCKPNGDVHPCGCKEAPLLGNINDPDFEVPHELDTCACYQNQYDPDTGKLEPEF